MSAHGGETADLDVRLLGPIEVLRGGEPVDLPGGRAKSLLAILALRVGQAVPSDRLIDELWGGDAPATAKTLLQGFVSKLRKAVGAEAFETAGNGYRLALDDRAIDVSRYRNLVEESRNLDGHARESELSKALAMWRGPALADVTWEPFAQRAITALENHRLTAREDLIEARLGLGGNAELVGELEGLVTEHPYRERLTELLVLALYGAGRQADALEALRLARETLAKELGLEPGPGLRSLEVRILNQDPSLDAPSPDTKPAPVESGSWLTDERRTVTVLFVEVTPADEDLDPEQGQQATKRALAAATKTLRDHGARVQESPGGVVIAWFGLPISHDDDPLRAATAARDARDAALSSPGPPREFRAGFETGEVLTNLANLGSAAGPVTTIAARLQQSAEPGEVLLAARAMRILRGAAAVERVRDGRREAWRLLGVDPSASLIPRDLDVRMAGREGELTRLRTYFSRTVRQERLHRMIVLGEAGIGKSRLARAFAESVGARATIATVSCSDPGSGQTFGLVHDLLVQAGGGSDWATIEGLLEQADRGLGERLAGIVGIGELKGPPQEFFGDLRRALELIAQDEPLALVVDDVHWAEPTLLDLFEYLTEALQSPVLLLLLARPELVENHPAWSTGGDHADLLYLDPLDTEAVAELIGDRSLGLLDQEDEQRIIAAAQGNPLFAEQLIAAWADGETGPIPPSLRSLLATRIDNLGPAERDLLRAASVAGDHLSPEALEVLAPEGARPFLPRNVKTLTRKRLLQPSGTTGLAFPHGLIRDSAYQGLTRKDRGRLHLALAEWLERSGQHAQLDAIVGHHLELALENRRLVGPADDDTALSARAGEKLTAAGTSAYMRLDLPGAADLLGRALELLPEDHPLRIPAAQHLAEASLPLGDHSRAQKLTAQLAAMPGISEVDRWLARLENARSSCMTFPATMTDEDAFAVAREALAFFEEAANPGGQAQAFFLKGWLHQRAGDPVRGVEAARRSLEVAKDVDATRERTAAGWLITRNLVEGPTPVPDCFDEIRSLVGVGRDQNSIVMGGLARVMAMSGEFEEARRVLDDARLIMMERMRIRRLLAFNHWPRAFLAAMTGHTSEAEREYRWVLAQFRASNEGEHRGEVAARLALVLASAGEEDEASSLAVEARSVTPTSCLPVHALTLAATARSLPITTEDSLNIAQEAVALTPDAMLNQKADLMVELARVEVSVGLEDAAKSSLESAMHLYERKGNVAAIRLLERA